MSHALPPSTKKVSKSLTPQRKHRKLTKDGSSEVWPEDVEKVFVQGLRQYWESPWATYSRGRSRWRNQYLVDYLAKEGIERSKKQVASHIQVLRNMWKGQAEFHLVAGGEELFLDTGLLSPVKSEQGDLAGLHSLAASNDSSLGSAVSPTSEYTTHDYNQCLEVSPTSPTWTSGYAVGPESSNFFPPQAHQIRRDSAHYPRAHEDRSHHVASMSPATASSSSSRHQLDPYPSMHSPLSPRPRSLHSIHSDASSRSSTYSNYSTLSMPPPLVTSRRLSTVSTAPSSPATSLHPSQPQSQLSADLVPQTPSNRISSLTVWAEGMQPYTVHVDAILATSPTQVDGPTRIAIRMKLQLPSIDDVRSPSTLHGFNASVTLGAPWVGTAQCVTSVCQSGTWLAQESGALQPVQGQLDDFSATALLPESPLSRSRWLNAGLQTDITQHIVVDGRTLAVVVYEFDRRYSVDATPSAALTWLKRHRDHKATKNGHANAHAHADATPTPASQAARSQADAQCISPTETNYSPMPISPGPGQSQQGYASFQDPMFNLPQQNYYDRPRIVEPTSLSAALTPIVHAKSAMPTQF